MRDDHRGDLRYEQLIRLVERVTYGLLENHLAPEEAEGVHYRFLLENRDRLLELHNRNRFSFGAGEDTQHVEAILLDIIRSTLLVPDLNTNTPSRIRILKERILVFGARVQDELRTVLKLSARSRARA